MTACHRYFAGRISRRPCYSALRVGEVHVAQPRACLPSQFQAESRIACRSGCSPLRLPACAELGERSDQRSMYKELELWRMSAINRGADFWARRRRASLADLPEVAIVRVGLQGCFSPPPFPVRTFGALMAR